MTTQSDDFCPWADAMTETIKQRDAALAELERVKAEFRDYRATAKRSVFALKDDRATLRAGGDAPLPQKTSPTSTDRLNSQGLLSQSEQPNLPPTESGSNAAPESDPLDAAKAKAVKDGKTIAEWFALHEQERTAHRKDRDRLRSELDASKRVMGCGYCGQEIWKYAGAFPMPESVHSEAVAAFVAHDRACPCNPLAAELDASLRREGVLRDALELALTTIDDANGSSYHIDGDACLTPGAQRDRESTIAAIQSALGAGSEEGRENRL